MIATADLEAVAALSQLVVNLDKAGHTEFAEQARNILARLGFAARPIDSLVLEFADALAAVDGAGIAPALVAGRLRNLVRGQW